MRIATLILISTLSGCAIQGVSTSQYQEGTKQPIKNEIIVDGSYSEVWDLLVKDLAKSFYVINNIDKESRIINVSFSTPDPEEYVDCGRTSRTFKEGDQVERYDYAIAGKSTFKVAAEHQENPAFSNYAVLTRTPNLEGRANIYLAPVAGAQNKTTISVNTRYILEIRIRGQAFAKHFSGSIQSRGQVPEETQNFTFNTNGSYSNEFGGGVRITCSAKGKIETEVLSLARR